MTALAEPAVITEPGVHDGMPDAFYHSDPVPGGSLSNSGAKLLLDPHCPAYFRWTVDHGRPDKPEFELGRAAHREVLGVGADVVLVDKERWDTKEVKADVKAIRDAGQTPVKRADWEALRGMVAALRAHPLASALLNPDAGPVEQSAFWLDPDTGIWLRARFDKVHYGSRTTVVDYKSCVSAHPTKCSKALDDLGYNRQDPWYVDGIRALGLGGDDTAFLLIFQEKTPPYLITVAEPDDIAVRAGRQQNQHARALFAECQSTGVWPGYVPDDDLIRLSLPSYSEWRFLNEESA